MRILITGGFGFLGGRLAKYLLSSGRYEIVLGSRKQVQAPPWAPEATVLSMDWRSNENLAEACRGVDCIVHLAALNAQECANNPEAALEVNALNTARLLRAAISKKVKRFVYASTAHVYASPLEGVIDEDSCPQGLHPYATSHRAAEDVVRCATYQGDIEGLVLRLSNTYGVPAHKDVNCWMLLFNDLCRQAVTDRQLTLHSSGLQRRDFVPMPVVCQAIQHLMHNPIESMLKTICNVGGNWAPTVLEIAELIQKRCSVVLDYEPLLQRQPPQANEESGQLEYRQMVLQATGFSPKYDRNAEIDGLLKFCSHAFASNKEAK